MTTTDRSHPALDRRRFLSTAFGVGGMALLGGPLLAACGSSSSGGAASSSSAASGSASGAAKDLGELTYQLSWVKNAEFAGTYLADDKGYFTTEGFSKVTLIGGGPSATPAETVVATKKALIATTSVEAAAQAILKGAPLKIVAAQYQKNPFAIVSLDKNPIKTPQDMIGKKIGVQAPNNNVWDAFLKANNLDPSKITKVPVQFDPLPLTQGTADGWFSFVTNEPIELEEKGFKTVSFLLSDFNYPLVGNAYIVRTDSLTDKKDQLKAFFKAEIKGWKDSLADPAAGAKLAAEKYGKDLSLNADEQTLESKAQNELILSGAAKTNGILTVDDDLIKGSLASLKIGGTTITAEQLFDMSLIKEVYSENPSLKA